MEHSTIIVCLHSLQSLASLSPVTHVRPIDLNLSIVLCLYVWITRLDAEWQGLCGFLYPCCNVLVLHDLLILMHRFTNSTGHPPIVNGASWIALERIDFDWSFRTCRPTTLCGLSEGFNLVLHILQAVQKQCKVISVVQISILCQCPPMHFPVLA